MADFKLQNNEEIRRAFMENERDVWIRNFRAASILAFIFMPAGSSLDWFVYRPHFVEFFKLRLICSAFLLFIWWFVTTPIGSRHYRILGWILPALPTFFISLMLYETEGFESPYYAGLNLVLLGAAIILRWTLLDSIVVFLEVMTFYLAACFLQSSTFNKSIFFNNVYFLFLTGVFVVIGSHFYNLLRFREFAFRYELDKSKHDLEESNCNLEIFNTKLGEQNIALNRANHEIKEAEAQLFQAEKMSSLGRFSAGLMHDILNPLNYSKTGLFTLHKKSRNLPPEMRAEFDPILTDIQDGVDRVQEIVQSLRNFTHPGEQWAAAIDLTAILNDARRFVSGGLNDKNISLELNIPPKQKVWIGRNDFSVVLINLLENSIDALEGKQFVPEEKPTIAVTSRSEGNRTVIAIRDNGPGIDPKIIAKIFDPFFTTKDVGKGTGLGLSICFVMIRSYGGTISVASEPGKFSEFTLDLPATAEAAAQTKLSHAEPIRL